MIFCSYTAVQLQVSGSQYRTFNFKGNERKVIEKDLGKLGLTVGLTVDTGQKIYGIENSEGTYFKIERGNLNDNERELSAASTSSRST